MIAKAVYSFPSPIFQSTDGGLRLQLAELWRHQYFPHQSVSIPQTFIYFVLHNNICVWLLVTVRIKDGTIEATTAYSGSVVSHHASRISLHGSRVSQVSLHASRISLHGSIVRQVSHHASRISLHGSRVRQVSHHVSRISLHGSRVSQVSLNVSRISLHGSRVRLMAPGLVSRVWRWVSMSPGWSSMVPRFQNC